MKTKKKKIQTSVKIHMQRFGRSPQHKFITQGGKFERWGKKKVTKINKSGRQDYNSYISAVEIKLGE